MPNDTPTYPNWFASVAQRNFEQFLTPLAPVPDLKFLQLGVFTGDASEWMLKNVLTKPGDLLIDVDTWKGSAEEAHDAMDFEDVYETYKRKMDSYQHIKSVRNTTTNFLKANDDFYNDDNKAKFDFIYIDADHTADGVLADARGAWKLLKTEGILAFDDYLWSHESGDPKLAPKIGIDTFLEELGDSYDLLEYGYQVWLTKRMTKEPPLPG